MIDLVCWLLDDYPLEVSTYGNNIALNSTKFKKNSFFVIILRFKNNLYSKITVNSNSNTNHFHELKVYSKDFTFQINPSFGKFYNGYKTSFDLELSQRIRPKFTSSVEMKYDRVKLPEPYSSANIFLIFSLIESCV